MLPRIGIPLLVMPTEGFAVSRENIPDHHIPAADEPSVPELEADETVPPRPEEEIADVLRAEPRSRTTVGIQSLEPRSEDDPQRAPNEMFHCTRSRQDRTDQPGGAPQAFAACVWCAEGSIRNRCRRISRWASAMRR